MGKREQEREEIQIQEYVRLQETFNTIIRSLERIERSDNINRGNTVKVNHEADRIHSEYESMREALITQCLCLQVGMTNRKFQNEQVKLDLTEQVERWKKGIKGEPSRKVSEALSIVSKAIKGEMSFNDYESGELPPDHSQAVESIFKARGGLEEKTNLAMNNPNEYYKNNEYGLRMGKNFFEDSESNHMEVDQEISKLIIILEKAENRFKKLEFRIAKTQNLDIRDGLSYYKNKAEEKIIWCKNELMKLGYFQS